MLKFPLVSRDNPINLTSMSRLKTHFLPLALLFAIWAATPVNAQNVYFTAATDKTFRQGAAKEHLFRGGSLEVLLRDGLVVVQQLGSCDSSTFFSPNMVCTVGSTGFYTFGAFGTEPAGFPYIQVVAITPAFIIEPTQPDSPHLYAAPASKLPRPLFGFIDDGLGVFYNLFSPDNLREYKVSLYNYSRSYAAGEGARMTQETVPGAYYFRFPKLNAPTAPVNIASTVRALPEGYAKVNSQFTGVNFDTGLGFDSDGFMRVSFSKPSTFRWSGIAANLVNANSDSLYFSIRYLADPADPLSETVFVNPNTGQSPASLFPGFVSGRDPRIRLTTPFVTSFSIPPIFPIGSTGVVELELNRNLAANAVVHDTSSRRYQIPIRFVSIYTDYASRSFGTNKKKAGILEDFDGDTFNNLTEWVLNSRAQDAISVPIGPVPRFVAAVTTTIPTFPPFPPIVNVIPAYFGFKVKKPIGYIPDVVQVLQRSISTAIPIPEASWVDMVSDANWLVQETELNIELTSKTGTVAAPNQPPGTAGHKYRFRVALTGL